MTPDAPNGFSVQVFYHYDSQNRLIQQDTASYAGTDESGVHWSSPSPNLKFVYDGTHLIQVLAAFSNKALYSYAGTPEGKVQEFTTYGISSGQPTGYYIVQNDAGGNAQQLINAQTGLVVASVKLDPWGKILSSSGSSSLLNAMGFLDGEMLRLFTGADYADNRWTENGRWLSPDPTEEAEGTTSEWTATMIRSTK